MRCYLPDRQMLFNAALGTLLTLALAWNATAQALPMAVTDEQARVEAMADSADFPLRYAVGLAPSLSHISGSSGGVSIFSAAAKTLGLRLQVSHWPSDQALYWQSEALEQPHVINVRDGEIQWLPDVPGELAQLTWSPETLPDQAQVTLELVYHGYHDLYAFTAKAAGDSASCNIDVACPQARDWDTAVRATTLITVGSGTSRSQCSASLLNNTANDNRPLLITARHCNVTSRNARSLNAVFNFQRSACGGANDGNDLRDVVSDNGSTWLAESTRADITLVVLNDAVPRAFNPHFGAWSAQPTAPTSGAGVHHPSGDQKKISLFDTPATISNNARITGGLLGGRSFNVDAWSVRWRKGATESGSSGSGLWNQNGALVGVLSGGSSSCITPTATDLYGRLSVAWDDSQNLRTALDPVNGGTSRASAAGRDSNSGGSSGGGGSDGGGLFGTLGLLIFALTGLIRRAQRR